MSDRMRARQFLPFDGLRGYGDLLQEAEREREEKRTLSEDRAKVLNAIMSRVRRKDRLQVIFYDEDSYCTLEGTVETVDIPGRRLCLQGRDIPFEDLWEIRELEKDRKS